jgi:transcription elongation GreA/GreB family factor
MVRHKPDKPWRQDHMVPRTSAVYPDGREEIMSVAFTREDSADAARDVSLPDRQISPHPNLVTESGLLALRAALTIAREAFEAARRLEDVDERRRATEAAMRDLNYFAERVRSAERVPAPASHETVAFGHCVTFERGDGRRQTFRIVGEDEADPREGGISYVSPLARALTGKRVGDTVTLGKDEIEILAID